MTDSRGSADVVDKDPLSSQEEHPKSKPDNVADLPGSTAGSHRGGGGPRDQAPEWPTRAPFKAWFGSLSFEVTEKELKDIFRKDRVQPLDIRLVKDRKTGKPRGFAYVEFESLTVLKDAVRMYNGKNLRERPMRVNPVSEKDKEKNREKDKEKNGEKDKEKNREKDKEKNRERDGGGDRRGYGGDRDRDRGYGDRDRGDRGGGYSDRDRDRGDDRGGGERSRDRDTRDSGDRDAERDNRDRDADTRPPDDFQVKAKELRSLRKAERGRRP